MSWPNGADPPKPKTDDEESVDDDLLPNSGRGSSLRFWLRASAVSGGAVILLGLFIFALRLTGRGREEIGELIAETTALLAPTVILSLVSFLFPLCVWFLSGELRRHGAQLSRRALVAAAVGAAAGFWPLAAFVFLVVKRRKPEL